MRRCKKSKLPILDDCGMCVDCVGTEEIRESQLYCESYEDGRSIDFMGPHRHIPPLYNITVRML